MSANIYSSSSLMSAKLGISLPNPAPEIDMAPSTAAAQQQQLQQPLSIPHPSFAPTAAAPAADGAEEEPDDPNAPKKKKYAKEAWPGKKPAPSLLV